MDFILQSDFILNHPEILQHATPRRRIVTSDEAIQVLREVGSVHNREVVNRALHTGSLSALPTRQTDRENNRRWPHLTRTAAAFLGYALDHARRHGDQDVFLVSDNVDERQIAVGQGLRVMTLDDLYNQLGLRPESAQPFQTATATPPPAVPNNRIFLTQGFLLGIGVSLATYLTWEFRVWIGRTFPLWGLAVGSMVAGISLYWFRSRYRLFYGGVEVLFGWFTVMRLVTASTYDAGYFFQLAAGLYVIVRGFDNIQKGMEERRIRPAWVRFFQAPSPT